MTNDSAESTVRKMRATCENCGFEYNVTNPPAGWVIEGTNEPRDDVSIICLGCCEFHQMGMEVLE